MTFKKLTLLLTSVLCLGTTAMATDYDFNGDGKADILWRNGSTNHLWQMHADGSHTYKNIGTKSSTYTAIGTADFNGDGITDILWRKGNINHMWYMHADGSHTYKNIGTKSSTYSVAATADFDGDGKADILWRKGKGNYLWLMKSNGSHTYKKISNKSTAYTVVGTADFNGDGKADILWRKGNTNHVWYMHADGTHTYKNIGTKSSTYTVVATADFNGDGKADILWRKGKGNYLWLMKVNGTHTYKNIGNKSINYTVSTIADFNGDGKADILWRKGDTNHVWFMHANGSHTYTNIGTKATSYLTPSILTPIYVDNGIRLSELRHYDLAGQTTPNAVISFEYDTYNRASLVTLAQSSISDGYTINSTMPCSYHYQSNLLIDKNCTSQTDIVYTDGVTPAAHYTTILGIHYIYSNNKLIKSYDYRDGKLHVISEVLEFDGFNRPIHTRRSVLHEDGSVANYSIHKANYIQHHIVSLETEYFDNDDPSSYIKEVYTTSYDNKKVPFTGIPLFHYEFASNVASFYDHNLLRYDSYKEVYVAGAINHTYSTSQINDFTYNSYGLPINSTITGIFSVDNNASTERRNSLYVEYSYTGL